MNVAGPSRVPPIAPRGAARESAYEQDLLELLGHLTLDEIEGMQTFFARRVRAGAPSDHDVAMNDLLQQGRALAVFDQDRALAQRIAAGEEVVDVADWGVERPVQTPRAVPQPVHHRAEGQRNGRHQAVRNTTAPQNQTFGTWCSSMIGWVFGLQRASQPGPTNTRAAPGSAPVVNRSTGHDCVICQDPIHGVEIRAPCGHYYDVGCVTDLFQSATRDETLYPPRCCRQNIPFAQVRPHLTQALIATFREKESEFSTLKRVYCSSPTCSRFLGPLLEGVFSRTYTCPAPGCGRRTCGKCREQHNGNWTHACRPDADATQVLELSRASGWARCPGCSQMIELHLGCFHMTCRCRTEFCYLCRARWKTCRCTQWDERRLLAVAEERVDAQLARGVARGRQDIPAQRARPIPVPVPPRQPRAPAENVWAQAAGARVPVPVPGPAQTPAVQSRRLPPTPARAPATSSTARQADAAPTIARTPTVTIPSASASASTPSTSSSGAVSKRVLRRSNSKPATDTGRDRMVRELMERLREDHECQHGRWIYRGGGGRCQSCGHHLPLYLFRCQGCEMLACNRCRRNRL